MSTGTQIEVVMPQMGVSVSEGTITRWLKQPGDAVAMDEPLLEISTDKVDTEVPSPGEGIVAQLLVQEGQTVEVGTVLAVIAPAGAPEPAPEALAPAAPVAAAPLDAVPPPIAAAPAPVPPAEPSAGSAMPSNGDHGRTFVSPVVARIAAEHGVDPAVIPGTGQGGRVTKKDILQFLESPPSPPVGALAPQVPEEPPVAATPAAVGAPAAQVPEKQAVAAAPASVVAQAAPAPHPSAPLALPEEVPLLPGETAEPMTAMRRGVMDHMRRSLDTSAHVTSAIEVDMSRVVAARESLKAEYQRSYGVNPTYLAFVAQATVETLKDWPWINGELRGEKIVSRSFVNLGIAVALDGGRGLIVPVIRNAQDMNLLGLARSIADLAERARTKKLLPDDVQGGTFTVTNPGGFGTFHGTPIINQPQVAILGTYALVKRPWVVQDTLGKDVIAIRPLMNITLTYDHRLVDGAYSGGFMKDLRERLEGWDGGA